MKLEIVNSGDSKGKGTVIKAETNKGTNIYGIATSQPWESPLGPTWNYLLDIEPLTLIDTGSFGSIAELEAGLEKIGFSLRDVRRIIITHGHIDHDGNCHDIMKRADAELWGHEIYGRILPNNTWGIEKELEARYKSIRPSGHNVSLHKRYHQVKTKLRLTREVKDGDVIEPFTFWHTPGHSPEGICIGFEDILFTGDHILPKITPHPSVKAEYKFLKRLLPEPYNLENRNHGLKAYLESLRKISALKGVDSLLPAHRLFHRGKFNLMGIDRAEKIVRHHVYRFNKIIKILDNTEKTLEEITPRLFPRYRLREGMYLAFTEAESHVEFLHDAGDVDYVKGDELLFRWVGTKNFLQLLRQ